MALVFAGFNFTTPTIENARAFWVTHLILWIPVTCGLKYQIWQLDMTLQGHVLAHVVAFYVWDVGMITFTICGFLTERLYQRKTATNRLFSKPVGEKPQFKGKKIVVLGNGPSLMKGTPNGKFIDSMDEVVRFNNFQAGEGMYENYTGTKTTVHFSDSMLYPSYEEYNVPGACLCLSLFMDRLVVSGSYFLFRMTVDLAPRKMLNMMLDPALGWLTNEEIRNVEKEIGSLPSKHPTSGCLAIDWFVRNRPDPTVPVYIHGFDFFQGPEIHYYSKSEPLYERLNDLLGVTVMHEPHKERAFVNRLVQEGKVKWIIDPKDRDRDMTNVHCLKQRAEAPAESLMDKIWTTIVTLNRLFTVLTYPIAAPFICNCYMASTPENARFFWRCLMTFWTAASGSFYYQMYFNSDVQQWSVWHRVLIHFIWFWAIDVAIWWSGTAVFFTEGLLRRTNCTNRLFGTQAGAPQFHGSKVCVLGNGPSLAKGVQHADLINSMDEVVRFNNFQAKPGPFAAWTGTKTTIHFSDSMLYPSYPEYEVPGACICLSLFMDRLMVSMSYFCFRMGIDLCVWQGYKMMTSPSLGWVPHDDIENLKKTIGISKWKHPTSGCLAIDWMVRNRPDKTTPVYIHGFDFFAGDELHYYSKKEPLYERLNDLVGVNLMHEPSKERAFVERLVKEGQVKWLGTEANEREEANLAAVVKQAAKENAASMAREAAAEQAAAAEKNRIANEARRAEQAKLDQEWQRAEEARRAEEAMLPDDAEMLDQ